MSASAPPPFDAVVLRSRDVVVVRLAGELDVASAPELAEALEEAMRDLPGRLIVDLKNVVFLDPAGARPLRLLASTGTTRLRLRGAGGTVRRVLGLLGLSELLEP